MNYTIEKIIDCQPRTHLAQRHRCKEAVCWNQYSQKSPILVMVKTPYVPNRCGVSIVILPLCPVVTLHRDAEENPQHPIDKQADRIWKKQDDCEEGDKAILLEKSDRFIFHPEDEKQDLRPVEWRNRHQIEASENHIP